MCTAFTYCAKEFYFGRTLDLEQSYGEEITVTPRNFPLHFRSGMVLEQHHAIIGVAHVEEDYPLYYDAVNEHGLVMAGLNFPDFAHYAPPAEGKDNVTHFELILWVLSQCASVQEVRPLLERLNITDIPFGPKFPLSSLHWIIADSKESVVVESMKDGLWVHPNPAGVLTNNPPFPMQMLRLADFMDLSSRPPENHFPFPLPVYSRGLGSTGLPGDLSSSARFVRAAFGAWNASPGTTEAEHIAQVFHIAETVSQTRGCCHLEEGQCQFTRYTVCINAQRGIYYYTTYDRRRITAVELRQENLQGTALVRFPMLTQEDIFYQKESS